MTVLPRVQEARHQERGQASQQQHSIPKPDGILEVSKLIFHLKSRLSSSDEGRPSGERTHDLLPGPASSARRAWCCQRDVGMTTNGSEKCQMLKQLLKCRGTLKGEG